MKRTIGIIFLWGILTINLYKVIDFLWVDFSILKNFPNMSYDDKMRHKIGKDFYDYTLFLKQHIPENATILIPPMRFPWPQTGNKYYLNYFLYPRKLIYGDEKIIAFDKDITYVLMLWGEAEPIHQYKPGWPKFSVPAEELLFWKNGNTEMVKKDFDPQKDMQKGVWGLIKIRRN